MGYLGAKSALWKATYNSDDVSTSSTVSVFALIIESRPCHRYFAHLIELAISNSPSELIHRLIEKPH